MRNKALLLITWLVILPGCIRYYETPDVRTRLARGLVQLDRVLRVIAADSRQKGAAAGSRFGELIASMARSRAALRAQRDALLAVQRDFDHLARGRERIRLSGPDQEKLVMTRARAAKIRARINALGRDYKRATDRLTERLQAARR